MSNRDEFPEKVKKVLQERVGNRCSNPDCRCLTSGPNDNPEKATRIGVAAHITAASANGPRYDSFLSKEERRSIFNAIWLCQNCGKLIDSDPNTYSISLLQRWKSHAEELARLEIEGGELKPEDQYEGYFCPHCDTFCKKGVTVCLGCNSDIYYGSTPKEWQHDFQSGISTTVLVFIFIFFGAPLLLNQWFELSLPITWGINILVILILGAVSAFGFAHFVANKNDSERKKNPPTFVRKRH